MQNQGQQYSNPVNLMAGSVSAMSGGMPGGNVQMAGAQGGMARRVAERIENATSILVALSKDPSVDEIAAALGLAMLLDSIGKRVTAIYSGKTPNALKFLNPEKTFAVDANSLQDFIIALNKDKADHLRYKIEGDFVKVYVTPYKTTITEKDLEFSHGDYNVDLVIALGVKDASDLDKALSEHGRIMHDAGSINISIDQPGKFGQIEWSNPGVSSVCELITKLSDFFVKKPQMTQEIATALLTGIVANTDRFMNEKTTPEVMGVASRLMQAGANQMLVSKNVAQDQPLPMGAQKVEQKVGQKTEQKKPKLEPEEKKQGEEQKDKGELHEKKEDFGQRMEEELSKPLKRKAEGQKPDEEAKTEANEPEKVDEADKTNEPKKTEAQELDDLVESMMGANKEEKKLEEPKETEEPKEPEEPVKRHFGAVKLDELDAGEDKKEENAESSDGAKGANEVAEEKKSETRTNAFFEPGVFNIRETAEKTDDGTRELEKMVNAGENQTTSVMDELRAMSDTNTQSATSGGMSGVENTGAELDLRGPVEPMGIRSADEQAEAVRQNDLPIERFASLKSDMVSRDESSAGDVLGENSASAGERVMKASIYPEAQDESRSFDVALPKAKDYGQMMDVALAEPLEALPTGTAQSPISRASVAQALPNVMGMGAQMVNPATQMAPVVMTQPEANHIPAMDYTADQPGMNEVPAMMNGSYLMTPQAAMQVMNQMAPTQAATGNQAGQAMASQPVMNPAQQMAAMPMPEINLPVAPAPPVDFTNQMLPPTEQPMAGVMQPMMQQTGMPGMMQPGMNQPMMNQMGVNQQPAQPLQSPVVIQPNNTSSAQQNNMTAGQLYQQNDPSAFRIPGM